MERPIIRKQYSDEQINKALELEAAGWKEPAIAAATGISAGSINRLLHRAKQVDRDALLEVAKAKALIQEISRLQRKVDESVAPNG